MHPDLPEIKIVRYARAKHLRLKVDGRTIRLSAPVGCRDADIQRFIAQSENWLIQTWQKQQELENQATPESLQIFNMRAPISIVPCSQKQLYYLDDLERKIQVRVQQQPLALKTFVKDYAKNQLEDYLNHLSQQLNIPFTGLKIRTPKTRWGSCSIRHDIMLHAGLVLMPEHLTRYICIHELAHTRYFDHSPRFWSEVARFDPDFQKHRQQLKSFRLPSWWYDN